MGVLVGLVGIFESCIGEISGILIVGVGIFYKQQEMLIRERAVGVAGI